MESEKAQKAFDLINSQNQLRNISKCISDTLNTEEPKLSIVSFAVDGPITIEDPCILKDLQRGIDYRIFEIEKEIHEL